VLARVVGLILMGATQPPATGATTPATCSHTAALSSQECCTSPGGAETEILEHNVIFG
jgi:hypothetical protein